MTPSLAILGGPKTLPDPRPHFVWPLITERVRQRVQSQLGESISIYDRSGVFREFEERFARYHGRAHALLCNSGTTSLFSMFFGAGLLPGDEVICPSYTFHATVSSLPLLGVRVVFCECLPNGNIDPRAIESRISGRTKAIVVTHLWGIPCEMDEVMAVAQANGLAVFEDCSHAHGSRLHGRLTGTFGSAAAWSLQGSKPISGGEGGILLTDDHEIYLRALHLGHYNKRARQETPGDHPLAPFALTGFGLKLRAHPLAVAIAATLLEDIDGIIARREEIARRILVKLKDVRCLVPPRLEGITSSWYALPLRFEGRLLHDIPIDVFLAALHAEGLVEIDQPGSTKPIHGEPLFHRASTIFAWCRDGGDSSQFPMASSAHAQTLKLPVWSCERAEYFADRYCEGIIKVVENAHELAPSN